MSTTPEQRRFLLISTLRQCAVREANLHYGGDLDKGIAGELSQLADEIEAEGVGAEAPTPPADWLEG